MENQFYKVIYLKGDVLRRGGLGDFHTRRGGGRLRLDWLLVLGGGSGGSLKYCCLIMWQ